MFEMGFGNTAEDPGCLDESGKGHNGAGQADPPQGAERNPKGQRRNSSLSLISSARGPP